METSDFEAAVVKLSAELAAEVLRLALMDMEAKYDPNQPRAPRGVSNGGQWVGGRHDGGAPRVGRSTRSKAPRLSIPAGRATRLLVSHPEAALGVHAIGLPAMGAGVALSRALGEFDRQTTGRDKTPFLKLPAGKLDLRVTSDARPKASGERRGRAYSPNERGRIDDECADLERKDQIKCDTYAAMYARSRADRKRIARICYSTVAERWSECKRNGGLAGVNTPLFTGVR